jgi:flagellar motor component MotA
MVDDLFGLLDSDETASMITDQGRPSDLNTLRESSKKIPACRLIGTLGLLIVIGVACFYCGGWNVVCVQAILYVFGTTFLLLLGTFGKDFIEFLTKVMATMFSVRPQEHSAKFAEIAQHGTRYALGAGAFGAIVGTIQIVQSYLSSPSDMGVGIAVALLSVFYSVTLSQVLFVFLNGVYLSGGGTE